MRHTDPGARPKKPQSREEMTASTASDDDGSDEVCLNVGFVHSLFHSSSIPFPILYHITRLDLPCFFFVVSVVYACVHPFNVVASKIPFKRLG